VRLPPLKYYFVTSFRRKEFYTSLAEDSDLKVKLTGGWEVIVGELDSFGKIQYRIWTFDNLELSSHHGIRELRWVRPLLQAYY
jgi:hypothetical protein